MVVFFDDFGVFVEFFGVLDKGNKFVFLLELCGVDVVCCNWIFICIIFL